ncbi:hypothetical protein HBI56_012930 [Parastagonospora nodorum]|uniref:Uncharacterized protein n=2 Tax=Phaeosphaeria nodorum (strain SN15 / ATCC MYA-4574 / FGSC 10173) TaxID=321614 RepID=A0A7U2EPH7_PHANO|nr:hypothetical protein SNOG_00133 [Parastagonospora nodorum SN15]KAH3920700.1 hypothetical protein HBH56_008680 [Parastagonospora nodorum]EAT91628.1 hypothetical protein SNOG_00133 [Parastagonospora nodorum SN15]KAH3922098.1 hypothetical protein HBH54_227130 [Parastagonospora nodorum]KAH3939365.1 hypothetical protein HBH53_236520 [Parastagonospora nodorum]KAH3986700.1 hypothetical protein HBH51_014620 [Parastagonospora nodorum]
MCTGNSTRISQGGSIAVLRPTHHLQRTQSEDDMLLFFSNRCSSRGTSVELEGWNEEEQNDKHWVVIHRDGDLSSSPQQSVPLYSFSLDSSMAPVMQLPQRLDLGVGDVGIIGRRVSVMTSSTKGPLTVAEGIIGWN